MLHRGSGGFSSLGRPWICAPSQRPFSTVSRAWAAARCSRLPQSSGEPRKPRKMTQAKAARAASGHHRPARARTAAPPRGSTIGLLLEPFPLLDPAPRSCMDRTTRCARTYLKPGIAAIRAAIRRSGLHSSSRRLASGRLRELDVPGLCRAGRWERAGLALALRDLLVRTRFLASLRRELVIQEGLDEQGA